MRKAILACVLALVVGTPVAALAAARGGAPEGPRTVELTIRYSKFEPATIEARRGEVLRIVVHNTDPIDHELIVGDEAVHLRHERGTEAVHPPRPGEVSVRAGETAETTWSVTGTVRYACHLPGHVAYGMEGRLQAR